MSARGDRSAAANGRDPRTSAGGVREMPDRTNDLVRRRFLFLGVLALVAVPTLVLGLVLDRESAHVLYSEDRLVENATVLAYGVAVVVLLAWSRASWSFRLHSALVVAILALRELDWHKAFTAESFMKITYYVRADDPLLVRLAAGLVLLAVVGILLGYLYRLSRSVAALRAGQPYAYSTLAAAVALPVSKAMDSGARMIHKHVGYDTPDSVRHWLHLYEETLELAIPLVMMLAVAQYNAARTAAR